MKFVYLTCIFLFAMASAQAQLVVYIAADNVVLRDCPEKIYNVLAILHPGCPLALTESDIRYSTAKTVNKRFYQVEVYFHDSGNMVHAIHGWVDRRYVCKHLTGKTNDGKSEEFYVTSIPIDNNPKNFNAGKYPPPIYKGAELQPPPFKKVYRAGPRGGCYYLNAQGKKVYVNKSLCK